MSHSTNTLVLGAGELGTPILKHLIDTRGKASTPKISVLVRPSTLSDPATANTDFAKYLEANNVTRIAADTAKATAQELSGIFSQYDTIISASGMAAPSGTQMKLAQAVLDAGVKRYMPWQFGLDYDTMGKGAAQDLFDEQLDVRALLRGQKATEWIIVSTGIFMTFLFESAFGVIEGLKEEKTDLAKVRALGSWENKVTYTHPEDIGRVVAELVLKKRKWTEAKNGVVFVSGDTASFAEVADAVTEASGSNVSRELWDAEFLSKDLATHPSDGLRKYRVVLANGVGVAWKKDISWNALQGISMTTVRDYARQLAQA